ncbi:MAG: GIY-YIG nuclease family protein [Fervidobacterium nodosum]
MKGSYILVLELSEDRKIYKWDLKRGLYVYVGSAMNNMEKRIQRHLSSKKKFHWHIDYLLEHATVKYIFMISSNKKIEEEISKQFSKEFSGPKGFGSTDLDVETNLYYINDFEKFMRLVSEYLNSILH